MNTCADCKQRSTSAKYCRQCIPKHRKPRAKGLPVRRVWPATSSFETRMRRLYGWK